MRKVIVLTLTFVFIASSILLSGCSLINKKSGDRHHIVSNFVITSKEYDISSNYVDISSENLKEGLLVFKTKGLNDSTHKIKFINENGSHSQTVKNDEEYVIPLCYGDGDYQVEILENVYDNFYVKIDALDCVSNNSDNAYLYSNSIIEFDKSDLTEDMESVINESDNIPESVCDYVDRRFSYDKQKAADLTGTPFTKADIKSSESSTKGICLDYCTVACAMMRMSGVPCKISIGTCSETGDLPHCWLEVKNGDKWDIIDPTLRDASLFFSENNVTYNSLYSF